MRSPFQFLSAATFLTLAAIHLVAGSDLEECLLEEPKPYSFKLTFSPAGGYNTNVILLGEGLPLFPGVSMQDAGFFEMASAATFDWKSTPVLLGSEPASQNQVTLSYDYKGDLYQGISGFDPGVHTWNAKYIHLFDKRWTWRLETKDAYTTIDGHSYSNKPTVASALTFQAAEYLDNVAKDLSADLVFSFTDADFYFTPSLPARDMTADNFSVEFSLTFVPKDYDAAKIKIGAVHYRNDADGSDYDYDRNRLQLNLETRFSSNPKNRWFDVKAIIKYFHDFESYDHPNSHAGPTGFAFKRHDNRDDLQAALTFDVLKYTSDNSSKFAVNIQYHYLRQDSNVPFYNYPQSTITAGCTYTFDNLKWR